MTEITHAMVLAAGLGTRMRPLTHALPKPLVKVAGATILDHILDRLEAAAIAVVVVNTHYLADQIESHLGRRQTPVVTLSHEDELLETGGGVRKALPLLGSAPFLVVNGDVLWRDGAHNTLHRLTKAWKDAAMDALLLLHPVVGARDYRGPGDFFLDQLGVARRRDAREVAPFVFTGIQLLHPRLFANAPSGRFSLNLLYDRAAEAKRLYGLVHEGDWFHIGTPESLARADAELGRGRNSRSKSAA